MKIAILTLAYTKNYGGILQCVALQNILKNEGHDVDVIHYVPEKKSGLFYKLKLFFSLFKSFTEIKRLIVDVFFNLFFNKTKRNSEGMLNTRTVFISNNINYTETVNENTIGQLAQKYDAIVVGSDKVWGGLGKSQLTYLFDWYPEYKGLRISYAACSSLIRIPSFNKRKIMHCLSKFNSLSVRDENTYNLVYSVIKIKPHIVADPTLLYDFGQFITGNFISEPYIFAYTLGGKIKGDGSHEAIMKRIKKKYGDMKVIAVVIADESVEAESFADKVIYDASVEQWLSLLCHATFVYTDSYHGCIFSMKYQKNFIGYYSRVNRSSRLIDLAKRYNIEKYIVSSVQDVVDKNSIEDAIDYNVINPLIGEYKNESFSFLINSLNATEVE